jgi:hypothetical protein
MALKDNSAFNLRTFLSESQSIYLFQNRVFPNGRAS